MEMESSAHLIAVIAGVVMLSISTAPVNATVFTMSGGDTCVPVGSIVDLSIALSDAPQGLSGLNLSIATSDPEAATITGLSFPDWAALHTNSTLPADQVWLKMVDLQQKVNPGDRNVPAGSISILAHKPGNYIVTLTPIKVEDDAGGRTTIASETKTLTICGTTGETGESQTTIPTQTTNTPVSSGTPNPGTTNPGITTPSPMTSSPTPSLAVQSPAPVSQPQVIVSQLTPAPEKTPSTPNGTTGATYPSSATPAPLSIVIPLVACIGIAIVFDRLKKL